MALKTNQSPFSYSFNQNKPGQSNCETQDFLQNDQFQACINAIKTVDQSYQIPNETMIHFVEIKLRPTNQVPEEMVTAFKIAKDNGMNVRWVSAEQVDTLLEQSHGNQVFILASFNGALFDRLHRHHRVHLYGPWCIFYCNPRLNQLLPVRMIPPYSLCMRHTFVTCTGLGRQESNQILRFVQLMGGHVSKPFRDGITHVVSRSQLDRKSILARNGCIPIMTPEWIMKLWSRSMTDCVDVFNRQLFNQYRLPLFAGLRICASQIDNREHIKYVVEENGGKYERGLYIKNTTHLILGIPEGEKYRHAKMISRIKIVKMEWIEQCLEKGYLVPEDDYLWVNHSLKSTNQLTTDAIISETVASSLMVEETMDKSGQTSSKRSASPASFSGYFQSSVSSNVQKSNNLIKEKTSMCAFEVLQSRSAATSNTKKITLEEELQSILSQSTKRNSSIFDGCEFYLLGFQYELFILLKKCIAVQGGIVSTSLRDSITHIVYGKESTIKELDKCDLHIQNCDHNIFKFDFDWLLACLRRNKLSNLPLTNTSKERIQNENTDIDSQLIDLTTKSLSKNLNVSTTSNSSSQRRTRILRQLEEMEKEDDNFVKEYLSQKSNSQSWLAKSVPSSTMVTTDVQSPADANKDCSAINAAQMPSLITTPVLNLPSTSGLVADDLKPKNTVAPEVNKSRSMPLENCVITFSGYNENEREQYKQIARELGAVCQDVFALRSHPSKDIRANTHLICDKQEGQKYEKCVIWKLFSVDKQWLFDCQKNKRRPNEEWYTTGNVKTDLINEEMSKMENDILDSSSQLQAKLRTVSSYFLQPQVVGPSKDELEHHNRKITIVPQIENSIPSGIPIAWNDRQAHMQNTQTTEEDTFHTNSSWSDNPLILLCGFTVSEKNKFSNIIEKLGGSVVGDKETNHDILVARETAKNEKFFTSLSSGKWIVHQNYLIESNVKRMFLDPVDFEWGTNKELTAELPSNLFECARACPRWREEIKRNGHKAFKGHNVIVISSKPNSFETIINVGGGYAKSLTLKSRDASEYENVLNSLAHKICQDPGPLSVSYILIDYHRTLHDLLRKLTKPMSKRGVCCAPMEYISYYLLQYPSPRVQSYEIYSSDRKPGSESNDSMPTVRKRTTTLCENVSTPFKRSKN